MSNLNKKILNYKKIILIFFWVIFILFLAWLYFIKPDIEKIPYSTIIYDENNIRIWEIIIDNKYRHEKIKFEEIPEFTKQVVISLEDKSFFSNIWIDFTALARALINNFSQKNIQWASTISSQVIRNNYWLNEKRTFFRKFKEFYLALALNLNYSKDEILSNYLWNIYFWYLNYWIKSASNYYFWKELKNLTKAEQLALIILPKNPKKYDPYKNKYEFRTRFELIAKMLNENHIIDKKSYDSIINEKLIFNYDHRNKLPYVIDYIRNFEKNLEKTNKISDINSQIHTNIDYNLTKKIEEIAKNSILPLSWKNVRDYAGIIIDKKTNDIKVMIGWINYYDDNWQVSMITARRQAWSTLKPFTYALAFQNLAYTPETIILDLPVQFQNHMWYAYNPKNYSLDYKWEVSVAEALSQSINIPAIKVADELWVWNLLNFLRLLWFDNLTKDENHYWLALTLWVWEVSLYELVRAYTIFAYDWNLCDFNIIKKGKNINNSQTAENWKLKTESSCKKIIDKKYTDMINYILTNRYFKLNEFPLNWSLDFQDKEVFLKTWTSRNFKDNWTIWYTKNYIIWVWAWNKDWSEMKWVSWASWAWEIFKSIVDFLEKEKQETNPIIQEKDKINYLEIISPLANSKYQISQSLPKDSQKIKLEFKTNIDYKKYKWFLNWDLVNDDFIDLKVWNNNLKLILYDKDDYKIKESSVIFYVE